MTVTITPLTPLFAGEVDAIDLRQVHDRESLETIRAGMDKYAVLVFRDQDFTNEEQLDFAQRFDGTLHARTSSSAIASNRFGNEALADVSNVDHEGKIRDANSRMRASSVANRLWHTDASFVDPPGRYSMLSINAYGALSSATGPSSRPCSTLRGKVAHRRPRRRGRRDRTPVR